MSPSLIDREPSGLQMDVGIGLWDMDRRANAEETSKTGENRFEEMSGNGYIPRTDILNKMGLGRNL